MQAMLVRRIILSVLYALRNHDGLLQLDGPVESVEVSTYRTGTMRLLKSLGSRRSRSSGPGKCDREIAVAFHARFRLQRQS